MGAVIITKDEDFVVPKLLETGPPVVWVRIGNTRRLRRADLLRRIEMDFPAILNALERGGVGRPISMAGRRTGPTRVSMARGGPRAHRECSRSLLLELASRAKTDYPFKFVDNLFSNP